LFNKTLLGHILGLFTSPKQKQLISLCTLSVCFITHPMPLCRQYHIRMQWHPVQSTCHQRAAANWTIEVTSTTQNKHALSRRTPPAGTTNLITQQLNHKTSGNKPDPNLAPTTTELRLLQPFRPLSPNSQSHPFVLSKVLLDSKLGYSFTEQLLPNIAWALGHFEDNNNI